MAQDTKRAVSVRKRTVFISFLPLVTTATSKYSEAEGASFCASLLYDWQTRMVWPKNIKIETTVETKTPIKNLFQSELSL